jgi:hypothetical protein
MDTYLLVHRHPHNYTGTPDTPAAWIAWFEELGSNLVDLGNPAFERTGVGNHEGAPPLGGYTIITAEDIDAAMMLAERCPIVCDGGGVEVGVLSPVPGRPHPARVF